MGTQCRYLNLITLDDIKIVPNGHTVQVSLVINLRLYENSSKWANSADNFNNMKISYVISFKKVFSKELQ